MVGDKVIRVGALVGARVHGSDAKNSSGKVFEASVLASHAELQGDTRMTLTMVIFVDNTMELLLFDLV